GTPGPQVRQDAPWPDHMGLTDQLVERAGPHPLGQGLAYVAFTGALREKVHRYGRINTHMWSCDHVPTIWGHDTRQAERPASRPWAGFPFVNSLLPVACRLLSRQTMLVETIYQYRTLI